MRHLLNRAREGLAARAGEISWDELKEKCGGTRNGALRSLKKKFVKSLDDGKIGDSELGMEVAIFLEFVCGEKPLRDAENLAAHSGGKEEILMSINAMEDDQAELAHILKAIFKFVEDTVGFKGKR